MSGDEAHGAARTVAGVVAAEAARAGARGVVLASPPGPESDLLAAWLAPALPVTVPDAGAVADVAGALAAGGAPGPWVEALAWQAAAAARGLADGLLPVGSLNKTALLLDPGPLPARVLPLGDVWASDVRALRGRATLPPVLAGSDTAGVVAAERALRRYLQEGVAPAEAFGALGALGAAVLEALDAAAPSRRGLLVPKLEAWTVGSDLAR